MIKCIVCGQEVTSKRGLAFHIKKHNINSVANYLKQYPEEIINVEPKDDTLLTCPICGRYNMKQLGQHIVGTHKMSHEEFLVMYPNQKMFVDEISSRCARAGRNAVKQYYINKQNDPERYKLIRQAASRKRFETDPNLGMKISTILRNKGVYEETSKRTKKMWEDSTYRKMQSMKCRKQHDNGLTDIILKNSGRKRYKLILEDKTYYMRSTWEIEFAKFLYNNKIEFKYEHMGINYYYNNKNRIYYPDFYIVNTNILFEVKPKDLIPKTRNVLKRQACLDLGYDFRYITENELKNPDTINLLGCYRT